MMHRIGFIILAVAAIAFGLVIGTLNSEPVTVDLLWIQLDWPLGLVMLLALILGLLIGILFMWLGAVLPARVRARKLERSGNQPFDSNDV